MTASTFVGAPAAVRAWGQSNIGFAQFWVWVAARPPQVRADRAAQKQTPTLLTTNTRQLSTPRMGDEPLSQCREIIHSASPRGLGLAWNAVLPPCIGLMDPPSIHGDA